MKVSSNLPPFLCDLLAAVPKAGDGCHNWMFRVCRYLHAFRTEGEIYDLLRAQLSDCGRHVPDREIWQAINNSRACAWNPKERDTALRMVAAPKWPRRNAEQVEAITAEGFTLADLREASPFSFTGGNHPRTEGVLDFLHRGRDVLLCCGWSQSSFDTRSREEWCGQLAGMQLIVPSPMTARRGKTSEGKESAHALSITGPRSFLVVEFDPPKWGKLTDGERRKYRDEAHYGGTMLDEHAGILWHFTQRVPLALVVHSGSRSLHGWIYCEGQPEARLEGFMREAATLGACTSTWTRSQFVRMPDGLRDNGKRQAIQYFHPEAIK